METSIAAHFTSPTSVDLRLLWSRNHSPGVQSIRVVRFAGEHRYFDVPQSSWIQLAPPGPGNGRPAFMVTRISVPDLLPDTRYEASWQANGSEIVDSCSFETLPVDLERPFTVHIQSCFDGESDHGAVGRAYRGLQSSPDRPNLNLLVGDQVYVDQPPGAFFGIDSDDLVDLVARRYLRSWNQLAPVLKGTANVCITDDHEYWNDYPDNPPVPWGKLATSQPTRGLMGRTTRKFAREVQGLVEKATFTIGTPARPELSFFVLDTRIHRHKSKYGENIAKPEDVEALVGWLGQLPCPGVLVMGQPLFAPRYGRWKNTFTSDHNIPFFSQYEKIETALTDARHDVLILAGDPHFGRVSRVQCKHASGPATNIFEVISSPAACLSSAPGAFSPSRYLQDWRYPTYFPRPVLTEFGGRWTVNGQVNEDTDRLAAEEGREKINYVKTVPTVEGHDDRTENHTMTVTFSRFRKMVKVEVVPWLVDRPVDGTSGLPEQAWRHTFLLDRPLHNPF